MIVIFLLHICSSQNSASKVELLIFLCFIYLLGFQCLAKAVLIIIYKGKQFFDSFQFQVL